MHFVPQLFEVKRLTSKIREVTEKMAHCIYFSLLEIYLWACSHKSQVFFFYMYVDKLFHATQLNGFDSNTVCAANAAAVFS